MAAPVVTHISVADAVQTPVEGLFFGLRDLLFGDPHREPEPQIEAIDMGRRGLHNEGAQLLLERLGGKIESDIDTARRIFTLVTALHWKG